MSQNRCLLVDVGATYVRFAEATPQGIGDLEVRSRSSFTDIYSAIRQFLHERGKENIEVAALAAAGPITGDSVTLTNAGEAWSFSKNDLMRELGFKQVTLVNDFEATALSLPGFLKEAGAELGTQTDVVTTDLRKIGGGSRGADTRMAVIGPGTGLGVAGLIPRGDGTWIVVPGEGGHATMPVATKDEADIINLIRLRWDHVSAERLLSGKGLVNIYNCLCLLHGVQVRYAKPEEVTKAAFGEPAELICLAAFRSFCAMLGTVASNVALTFGSCGGVFIAGGILPQFPDEFEKSSFRSRFENKGRLSGYLRAIPTYLVSHPAPALRGLHSLLFPG
jgi:glucokinase